jgi:enoyl-CoA hydratase/carnithine racemase
VHLSAVGWDVDTPADRVVRVAPADPVATVAGLRRIAADHHVLLATDLQRWAPDLASWVASHRMPVVGTVRGRVASEALLNVLAADVRIGSDQVEFEFGTGGDVVTDAATLAVLVRLVGSGTAGYWVLTRRTVSASEAAAAGLLQIVIGERELERASLEVASSIATGAPLALAYAKEALRRGAGLGLDAALDLEADLYTILHPTRDRQEGVDAFLEHRHPSFEGR